MSTCRRARPFRCRVKLETVREERGRAVGQGPEASICSLSRTPKMVCMDGARFMEKVQSLESETSGCMI